MLLIDGHNLIGATPGLSLSREEEGREHWLRRLAAVVGGEPVVVVFDGNRPGSPKEQRFGGLRVVYAPAGRPADEEILRRTRIGKPRSVTVVTSDRELGQRARALGARVLSCEAFRSRLVRPRKPSRPEPEEKPEPDAVEVERWLRVFAKAKPPGGHKM